MEEYFKTQFREQLIVTIEHLIKHLRHEQKEFNEGRSEISGIFLLGEILKKGTIKMDLYLQIKIMLENLEAPYEIILKDG